MNRTATHLLSNCNWSASELSEAEGRFTEVTNIADFELEEIDCNFEDIPQLLRALSPGIIKFEVDAEPRYLIIVGSRRGNLNLLGREEELVKIPVRAIADIVKQPVEAGHTQLVSPLLSALSCSPADVGSIRDALVSQRCASERIRGFWTIRPKQLGFREVLRNERISQLVLKLLSAHCLFYLLFLGSWILIGRGLISGRFDSGWIVAWILALTLTLPVRALSLWLEGQLAISLSSLVKQFLLKGITNVDLSVVRTQGSGGMLGLV